MKLFSVNEDFVCDKVKKTSARAVEIGRELLGNEDLEAVVNFVNSSELMANKLDEKIGPEEDRDVGENKFLITGIDKHVRKESLQIFIKANFHTDI